VFGRSRIYCPFAERIEKAGAILIGKTNSPSFGFRGTTDNYLFGPTRNPFKLTKNAGGSSGGSAAAVADGLVPLAEGADAGGSIRIPASWCGVFGFKPSFGRAPFFGRPNAFGSFSPFLSEGPITRTVEDAAVALTALSGYDSRDPFSLPEKSDFSFVHLRGIEGWKIAYSPNFDVFTVDRRVSAVIQEAVNALENAGAIVEEVKLGIGRSSEELGDLHHRSMMPLYLQAFENFKKGGIDLLRDHRGDFPSELLKWVEIGLNQSTLAFYRDLEVRTEIYDAIQGILNTYDLLVTPTLACLPVDNAKDGNTVGPSEINGVSIDPMIGWILTYFLNFSGHPAASVPAGLTKDNLPVGMQIIGKRYGDADVLTANGVLERVRPWEQHYAICARRQL
jgi:amidase